jgi:FSR family fosmidomycin resistance protein-like MFS transporter
VSSIETSTSTTQSGGGVKDSGRGSLAAWVNLYVVSGAHAVIHATVVLMPLIYPILHDSYGMSYTQIGLLTSIPNLVGGLLQLVFGYLGRYVARKVLIGVGNVLVGVSLFLTATATAFAPFLGWGVLRSIAGAPQHPVGSALLTDSFPSERRGFALAAHVAGGNLGTLVVPAIGLVLIGHFGWQPTLALFALPGVLAGTLVVLFAREPAHIQDALAERRASRQSHTAPRTGRSWLRDGIRPLRHRAVLLLILGSIVAAGGRGLGILTTYFQLYMKNGLGFDDQRAGLLFTVLLIGSVVGPLLGGRVSDRVGRKLTLLGTYVVAAVFLVLLPLVASVTAALWALVLIVALVGITAYVESPLLQAYLADVAPAEEKDAAFGWYFTLAFGVGSLWGTAVGVLIDATKSFPLAFVVMAGSYLLAGAVILCVPRPHRTHAS